MASSKCSIAGDFPVVPWLLKVRLVGFTGTHRTVLLEGTPCNWIGKTGAYTYEYEYNIYI